MADGRIITTGDKALAKELEARGYEWVMAEHRAEVTA
jgi:Fe-S cluster assembly ATP-binding protein